MFARVDEGARPEKEWFSIFPVENDALLYDRWEDDIIWDAKAMDDIPAPKMLTLDLNDDNIILKMPDDKDPDDARSDKPTSNVEKKKDVKRSRLLLGKAGIIKDEDVEEEEVSAHCVVYDLSVMTLSITVINDVVHDTLF